MKPSGLSREQIKTTTEDKMIILNKRYWKTKIGLAILTALIMAIRNSDIGCGPFLQFLCR